MIASGYSLLVRHPSGAADEVLLEALRLGDPGEQSAALEAILQGLGATGLAGAMAMYADLPAGLRRRLAGEVDALAGAAAGCSHGESDGPRISVTRFIAEARSPRLMHLLADLLRAGSPEVYKSACAAAADLADWCIARREDLRAGRLSGSEAESTWSSVIELSNELQAVVARALDTPRGADSPALARAASLLLEDRRGRIFDSFKRRNSRVWSWVAARLARTQEAALVGSGIAVCNRHGCMDSGDVLGLMGGALEGLLDHAHWLADPAVHAAAGSVVSGPWWSASTLQSDLEKRMHWDGDVAPHHDLQAIWGIVAWLTSGGVRGGALDDLLEVVFDAVDSIAAAKPGWGLCARVSLLRAAEAAGRDGASLRLLGRLLTSDEERLARMAARGLSRQGSHLAEAQLVRHAAVAPESVRGVIARAVGLRSFHSYWNRFYSIPEETRATAGRALLKLVPDAMALIRCRILSGPVDERVKALAVVSELQCAPQVREAIVSCCDASDARLRSKAVLMLGDVLSARRDRQAEHQLDNALADGDARVRANAIEVLERTGRVELLPLLEARSRLGRNRERANAARAMSSLRLVDVRKPLFEMLRDGRDAHRLSGIWAVEQTGQWKLLDELVRLARTDRNPDVRRSALSAVQRMAERMRKPAAA